MNPRLPKNPPQAAFECLLPYYWEKRPPDWNAEFDRPAELEVEIGSGLGEFLVRRAVAAPTVNFIGIETDWQRVYKFLKRIKRCGIKNVRVLYADAWVVFERFIPPLSVQNIFCLFPCPWPKRAQEKHRLFNRNFLKLVNSRLKPGGTLQIVTDHPGYVEWIEDELPTTGFRISRSVIPAQFETKFEKKWKEHGQDEFFEFQLLKIAHQDIPVKEDCRLQDLTVKNFSPDRLQLRDLKGETQVIFKDFLFDPKQKKGMILCFVVEANLTQPIWLTIIKKKAYWRILPLPGCPFIPTPGVQKAMELMRELAAATSSQH